MMVYNSWPALLIRRCLLSTESFHLGKWNRKNLKQREVFSVRGPAVLGIGEGPESRLTIYEGEKERKTIYKRPSS